MKHRLAILAVLVLSTLFGVGVTNSYGGKGGSVSPQDACAASLAVEDASACGGVFVWVAISSSPPGGPLINYYWSYCGYQALGWINYSWNNAYLYTMQCRTL